MSLLVDYRCPVCGRTTEVWATTPPAPSWPCAHCGAQANRVWSPFGIGHSATPPQHSTFPARPGAPLCVSNPDVPGLCHMTPAAGRAWLARARKDGRALDRELERQEKAAGTSPPTIDDVVSHHHSHPGHTEPGHTEHGHTEPGHTEPGHTEPGHSPPEHSHTGARVSHHGEL